LKGKGKGGDERNDWGASKGLFATVGKVGGGGKHNGRGVKFGLQVNRKGGKNSRAPEKKRKKTNCASIKMTTPNCMGFLLK